jgi:hypothetical protein
MFPGHGPPIHGRWSQPKPFNLWLVSTGIKMISGLDAVWGESSRGNVLRRIIQGKINFCK